MKRVIIIVLILVLAVVIVTMGMLLRDRSSTAPPAARQPGGNGTAGPGGGLPVAGSNDGGNTGNDTGGNGVGDGLAGGDGAAGPGGGLPVAGISTVTEASVSVLDYSVTPEGTIFVSPNGDIAISSAPEEILGRANFGDILGTWFSPSGEWLLVKSRDEIVQWDLFNVSERTWRNLSVTTSEMSWSLTGDQIAYIDQSAGVAVLTIMTAETGAIKTLTQLAAPDLRPSWGGESSILLIDKPSSLVQTDLWSVSTSAGTIRLLASNIPGGEVLWGGAGNDGLLFRAGPTGGILTIIDSEGKTQQTANFLTLVSKCKFGEGFVSSSISNIDEYLFCAIPQNSGAMKSHQLPDDYMKGQFSTTDRMYAVSLKNGVLTPLTSTSQTFNFDAENLKIHGDTLYFVNRLDQKLYQVSLSVLKTEDGNMDMDVDVDVDEEE